MRNFTSKVIKILFFAIALVLLSSQTQAQKYEKYYEDGKLYVKFKDSYNPEIAVAADKSVTLSDATYFTSIIAKCNVKSIVRPFDYKNDPKLIRTFELKLEDHSKLENVIAELEKMPEIEYAEKVPMQYIDYQPNDSLYNLVTGLNNWNWHLDVIHAEEAWDITQGSPTVNVAIVDNAIWSQHPDLHDKIVLQRDVIYNTNSSDPPGTGDPSAWSHGTHCAGLATAITDNGIGIAGIGYSTSIIAVKAANNSEPNGIYGQTGMSWAMNNGADVISMSYGGPGYSQTVQNLVNSGTNNGIVFVAAAGNDNNSLAHYPSNYDNVISVAATNENDAKASFSNYNETVDVSAPGGSGSSGPDGLLSSTYDNTSMGYYDAFYGTSMACPMVSGLVSLLFSLNPELSPAQIETILETTADNIDAQNPDYIGMIGSGRINAYQAVLAVPYEPQPDFMVEVPLIMPGTAINFQDMSLGIPTSWSWTFEGGTPATSNSQNPSVTYNTEGTFDVTLEVSNEFGTMTITKEGFIVVTATPSPYLSFTVNNDNACIMESVGFIDQSLYLPTAWNWSFEPDSYEFVSGTSANSQNPLVQFTEPGVYTVIFEATNANGTSSTTYSDYLPVAGMLLPYEDGFESGIAENLELMANEKAAIMIDSRAANTGAFGLHFTGVSNLQGWTGGPANTTPEQAWENNVLFHSTANVCNVNATDFAGVYLTLDLRQTYSLGTTLSWFRVLVNETEQIPDVDGNLNFNPTTNSDPFVERKFNLQPWAGGYFSLQLQASCRLFDNFFAEGDNVFVDNVKILGSLVGVDELTEVPFDIVSVYPNPANEMVTIKFTTNTSSDIMVSISSISGQLVYQANKTAGEGTTFVPVSVSNLAKGVYVVNVKSVNGIATQKIVIE
ncbi:MAG: S8 family serine peptidase [Bacteroidales bacterium]|nr:S8 family serine peptidase [Bacteroidales bacterium]